MVLISRIEVDTFVFTDQTEMFTLNASKNVQSSGLRREHFVLMIIVVASASYTYFTMANSQLYIDEVTYARVGFSLIQGHLASDSALLPIYEKFGLVRSDIWTPFGYIDSVEPWLDHPPLVPLLLVPVLVADAPPRLLPIIFSSLIALLIFFILRGRPVLAWASTLVWLGFFITHPILSMLFIDAGVAFFNLLTVALINEYTRTRSSKQLYLAGFTAAASTLSKLFGIASLLYLLTYLLSTRLGPMRKDQACSLKPFFLAVGIASIWPVYGLATAAPLFVQLLLFNASRSVLSSNFLLFPAFELFSYTKNAMYASGIDPALLIGWASIVYLFSKKDLRVVQLSPLCYLLVVAVSRYAWFYTLIPMFPFFAIGIGVVLDDLIYKGLKSLRCGLQEPRR
jgi:hypothetical protein